MRNPDVMSTPERDRRFGEAEVTVKFYKGNMANVERLTREQAEALRQSLTAFLDGAPEPEWEWEYCYRSKQTGNRWGSGSLMDAQLGAKALDSVIERRRPAGPWLPVEGEGR